MPHIFEDQLTLIDKENSGDFDPILLSEKISIFNHTKHRDIKCRYFTPSFNKTGQLYILGF